MSKLQELIDTLPACRQAGALTVQDLPDNDDKWYTYVILCENGSLYKGFTQNLKKRYFQHCQGKGAEHTKKYKPVAIIYFEEFECKEDAISREKYFKSGSGREWLKNKLERLDCQQAGDLIEQIK